MSEIVQRIQKELQKNTDAAAKKNFQRFFKEPVKFYGVKTGTVGKIAKKYWSEVKELDKKEIFKLCEELYATDHCETAFVVSLWCPNLVKKFKPADMAIFKKWILKYVNNWAKCDGFCNHTVGDFIQKYPEYVSELKNWTKSKNRWLKRAAAVSLIVPAKRGEFLKEAFEIATALMADQDDMVQKGYGWLLKEESRKHQREVFEYVFAHKEEMPRTALRYAIELMPKELKARAMQRG